MKKTTLAMRLFTLVTVLGAMALTSCEIFEKPVPDPKPTDEQLLQQADRVMQLSNSINNWDEAYLSSEGFFCYSKTLERKADETSDEYATVTFANGRDTACVVARRDGAVPVEMITSQGDIYFSFPNDTILELLFDDGNSLVMLDSIAYQASELMNSTDKFRSILTNTVNLLKRSTSSAPGANATGTGVVTKYRNAFAPVLDNIRTNGGYGHNEELIDQMNRDEANGEFRFAQQMGQWYDNYIGGKRGRQLMLWTGKASYKVGGSSCTLSGTVWCPGVNFNHYGTYGIVCDTDPSKLYVGQAEYEGTGYQAPNGLSYSVDFRGLKPNTTYYYRAYFRFNSSEHGAISPKYKEDDLDVYDSQYKSFTTSANILAVDVVMCIDVTGSMSGVISTVKNNAIAFYDLFKAQCDAQDIILTSLTTQVIAFRDLNVDSRWLEKSPTYTLPAEKSEFKSFVNGLYASGGGDTPESGLEALQTAFNKDDWGVDDGFHRQVIILWTDAPYLIGSYSSLTVDMIGSQWNTLPSGRRLIIFAPNGTESNGGSWSALDGWRNVIHETDITKGFNSFEYILQSIIGELTSKAPRRAPQAAQSTFTPNE